MQMSIGLDRLKRFVCLLLIFVLLFCFFMCPRASAVALEATTVAYAGLLVGTLLVGAGVVFSNPGDMAKAGNAMYRTLQKGNEAIASKIAAISVWAVDHGKSIGSAALRIGKDLYQGIVDTFNAAYSGGKLAISDNVTALTVDNAEAACNYISHQFLDSVSFVSGDDVVSLSVTLDGNYLYVYRYVNGVYVDKSGGLSGSYLHKGIYLYADGAKINYCLGHSNADISISDHVPNYGYFEYAVSVPCRISTVCNIPDSIALPKPDLVYPSDNNLVRLPDIPSVDTDTGEVTYPDSIAYTKDAVAAPYPIGDDGVKVPDIPFDVPVDQTSGKPMDDTGTDTDNPSKPGEGTDTDKPSVNWPSAGDISLPKLIISKFPFCIPFDVARLIGLLEADPKTPIFHVPLKVGTILDEEIVLDLSQWDNAVRIIRWGELIVFVAGLVLVTRNYIKW